MNVNDLKNEFYNMPDKDLINLGFQRNILKTDQNLKGLRTNQIIDLAKKYKDVEITKDDLDDYYELTLIYFIVHFMNHKTFEESFNFINENSEIISSWAITDTSVRFIKDLNFENCKKLINQKALYTRRFGYVGLLKLTKNKNLTKKIFELFDDDPRYYVKMAEAWVLSYLFIENFEETLLLVRKSDLNKDIILKGIQKSIDSYRINESNKTILKELRKEIRDDKQRKDA